MQTTMRSEKTNKMNKRTWKFGESGGAMKRIFWVALTFCFCAWMGNADAAKGDPMSILKDTQKKLQEIVDREIKPGDKKAKKKRAEEIKALLEPLFDFDHLAKKALAKHWDKRTKGERKAYKYWLKALLKNAYLRSLNPGSKKKLNKADGRIEYRKQKVGAKKATVFTRVKYRTKKRKRLRRVRVDWVFYRKTKKDNWLVGDLVTNDNSLVETYEEQFDKIIRKKSFKALLKKLKKKVNAMRKKAGLKPLEGPK